MAGGIWTNAGLNAYSQAGAGFASSQFKFGLFNNNHTPVVTDVIGAFTQPSNTGYSKLGIMGWPAGGASLGVVAGTVYVAAWTFTANAFAESLYGWTCEVNPGSGLILACAKLFTTPWLIPPAGSPFTLTFNFSLQRLP